MKRGSLIFCLGQHTPHPRALGPAYCISLKKWESFCFLYFFMSVRVPSVRFCWFVSPYSPHEEIEGYLTILMFSPFIIGLISKWCFGESKGNERHLRMLTSVRVKKDRADLPIKIQSTRLNKNNPNEEKFCTSSRVGLPA
jgi:hypothetical protein